MPENGCRVRVHQHHDRQSSMCHVGLCYRGFSRGQARYLDPVQMAGPLEFIGAQGIIGRNEDGEIDIHLHGAVAGEDMHAVAGHFAPSGQ